MVRALVCHPEVPGSRFYKQVFCSICNIIFLPSLYTHSVLTVAKQYPMQIMTLKYTGARSYGQGFHLETIASLSILSLSMKLLACRF